MSTRTSKKNSVPGLLDNLIAKFTVDASGEDEQLWTFRQAFEDNVALPADGFIIGEPVSLVAVEYDGNTRLGLTARCRRENGSEYVVAFCDIVLPLNSEGELYLAAYRRWLNLDPFPAETQKTPQGGRQHKVADDDIDLSKPVELAVLSVKESTARCRLLEKDRVLTLRASRAWELVHGCIVTVKPRKQWRFSGHPYLSGEIQSHRIDVTALDLVPLELKNMGTWDPKRNLVAKNPNPSKNGPGRSSPMVPAPCLKWNWCCQVPTQTIPFLILFFSPMISGMQPSGQRPCRS